MLNKLISFLKEVELELKKVNWPSRERTIKYTLTVLGISAAVAAFLGTLDLFFTAILKKLVI
jgi:preprotein translocase subunit SecE